MFNEKIRNMVLQEFNDNLKKETLDEYLNSFKLKELRSFIILLALDCSDKNYSKILVSNKKKDIIQFIKENFVLILEKFVKLVNPKDIKFLKKVLSKYSIEEKFIIESSLYLLMLLDNFNIAKIKYYHEINQVSFYFPNEFSDTFLNLLDDSSILFQNKFCTNIN